MYMNQEELERLVNKSDRQLFINDLNTGFGLSQVEAESRSGKNTASRRKEGVRNCVCVTKR